MVCSTIHSSISQWFHPPILHPSSYPLFFLSFIDFLPFYILLKLNICSLRGTPSLCSSLASFFSLFCYCLFQIHLLVFLLYCFLCLFIRLCPYLSICIIVCPSWCLSVCPLSCICLSIVGYRPTLLLSVIGCCCCWLCMESRCSCHAIQRFPALTELFVLSLWGHRGRHINSQRHSHTDTHIR